MNDRSEKFLNSGAMGPVLPEEPGRRETLTRREQEILSLIARGQANKEMAQHLDISVRTVEAHRARIMRKLGLRSHAGLIYYATRWNISTL